MTGGQLSDSGDSDDVVDLTNSEVDTAPEPTDRTESDTRADDFEGADADDSWLQELKDYKEIHGLSTKELLAALKEGNIPDALMDKLFVNLKDGDKEWRASLSEYRDGAMRAKNHTKKMQALAEERKSFESERGEFRTEREQIVHMFQHWKQGQDGKSLLHGLRKLGMPVEAAARAFAQELATLEEMGPAAQAMFEEKQNAESELYQLRQQQDYWRQQHEAREQTSRQQQEQVQMEQTTRFVQDTAVAAFAKAGVNDIKPGVWNLFQTHLRGLWEEAGSLNADMIAEAVTATREDMAERVARLNGDDSNQPAARPVVKTSNKIAPAATPRLDGGAPRVAGPSAKPKRISPDDFRKRLLGDL